jgi:hypothetical protein
MARSWDEGRREGRWDKQHLSDEEEKRIQKGIDDCMRSVIADRHYDPVHALDATTREAHDARKVIPGGAGVAKVPGVPEWKGLAEPWKNSNPTHDFLRLGTTVAQANVESAESALMGLPEEEEPTK